MNFDQSTARSPVWSQPGIALSPKRLAHGHEGADEPNAFDTDDIALIARTLNAAADAALFPQQAVPLRKLADLLTDAMETR